MRLFAKQRTITFPPGSTQLSGSVTVGRWVIVKGVVLDPRLNVNVDNKLEKKESA